MMSYMNIKRAKEEIIHAVSAYLKKDENGDYMIPEIRQRPILLMGPPGIGKTQIMEQIAGELDLALVAYTITHHTRQSAIGLPFIEQKMYDGTMHSITKYTMSEIIASVYDRMEESGRREGLLFIDEINCVSETLAPTMLQFLQGKSFGNQKVPKGWIIVAAGNPPEYNRSVRDFDVVTLDRVKVIQVEADFGVWKEYAYSAGIHESIIAYLDIHKENFYRMETTVDGKQFVTARGWEDLSELIYAYEELGLTADREVTIQYLQHPVVAKDFANYLSLYYKYRTDYRIDEILSGTIRPGTLNKLKFAAFDERLQVVSLLLARLSENFRAAYESDACAAKLMSIMKGFRRELQSGEDSPGNSSQAGTAAERAVLLMQEIIRKETGEMKRRLNAGQNEKEIQRSGRRILTVLEAMAEALRTQGPSAVRENPEDENEALLSIVRGIFREQTDRLDAETAKASQQLEYAFDFMEQAFGEGQEMVVFVTELSIGRYAVWFLRENDCDRYYMYNKNLLFDEREAGLRSQINDIRDLQIDADGRPES